MNEFHNINWIIDEDFMETKYKLLVKELGSEGLVGLAAIWVLWGIYSKK